MDFPRQGTSLTGMRLVESEGARDAPTMTCKGSLIAAACLALTAPGGAALAQQPTHTAAHARCCHVPAGTWQQRACAAVWVGCWARAAPPGAVKARQAAAIKEPLQVMVGASLAPSLSTKRIPVKLVPWRGKSIRKSPEPREKARGRGRRGGPARRIADRQLAEPQDVVALHVYGKGCRLRLSRLASVNYRADDLFRQRM